jgi:VIT family
LLGLIFGVAATTTRAVLIAGACGAAAAAVSMMAGAYLDAETTRDEANVTRSALAPVYKVHRVGVCGCSAMNCVDHNNA